MLQEGGGRSPAECESLLPVFARVIFFFPPLLLRRLLLLLPVQRTMGRLVWRAGVDQSLDADGVLNNGCMRAAEGLSSCVLAAEPLRPSAVPQARHCLRSVPRPDRPAEASHCI